MKKNRSLVISLIFFCLLGPILNLPPSSAATDKYFFEITIMLDPANIDSVEIMKSGWEKIGIKVNVVTLEFSTMMNRYLYGESFPGATYKEGGFDICLTGWGTSVADSLGIYHSDSRIGLGRYPNYNMMMFNNGEVDMLLEEGLQTVDKTQSIEIYRRVEEIVHEELPIIYVFRDNTVAALSSNLVTGEWLARGSSNANLHAYDFSLSDKTGGEMVFIGDQNPPGLNAAYSITTVGVNNALLIQEPLLASSLPIGTFEPILAESYSISPDGKTYTFNIRKGVKWQDGEPFDANDVKFTYDLFMNPNAGFTGHSYFAKYVKEVRMIDEYTIEMELNQIYPPAEFRLATVPMLPKHILENVPPENLKTNTFNKSPIGTGAFKVVKWVDDEYIQYMAFNDYWRGTPKLDSILFRVMPDKATGIASLQAGEINLIFQQIYQTALIQNYDILKNDPKIKLDIRDPTGTNYLIINLMHPILGNKFVRQAMAHAIDVESIVKGPYNGLAAGTSQWYSKYMEGYYNPDLKHWEYNLDIAKQKMELAGYKYSYLETPSPSPSPTPAATDWTMPAIGGGVAGVILGALLMFFLRKQT